MSQKLVRGHISAIITIIIWGTTFVSTKILLEDFQPIEILFFRFILGLLALYVVCPHLLVIKNKKEEITFLFAGLSGVCLYYLLENIALTYTLASNVGVIISIAPFFTAFLTNSDYCKYKTNKKSYIESFFCLNNSRNLFNKF